MAEVLSLPHQTTGTSHFGNNLLRRSTSQSSLPLADTELFHPSSISQQSQYRSFGYENRPSSSLPSSAPSSPHVSNAQFSNSASYTSTPSSSLSLETDCAVEDEDILFPSYTNEISIRPEHSVATPPIPAPSKSPPSSKNPLPDRRVSNSISNGSLSTAGDDMDIKDEPTRHVDYLSHNWKEEDIWSSWKHITARRKAYTNSNRLENASWRTWAKSKYQLKTVSPETLNWMKDHDVTWLYGPLQTNTGRPLNFESAPAASGLSRSNSFGSKKPILKKKNLSELMLQRSISSSTLIQQATDALKAQQPRQRLRERPILGERALSDFLTSSNPETPSSVSTENESNTLSSSATSGRQTPCTKRHIHFNNEVEQCIAINDDGQQRGKYGKAIYDDSDSDSEEDLLMMKPVPNKSTRSNPGTPRNSMSSESKTIAMLPSTTLKYRGDTPDPVRQNEKQNDGAWHRNAKIPPSPSQETIKASGLSGNFLVDDENDDDGEMKTSWQPSAGRRNSILLQRPQKSNFEDKENDSDQHNGLRRTPSGMFMPYSDEDDIMTSGFLGKVIGTVNTAKDIAHVIWNVGWRG
ncbi:MAG: hypothetical protein Q9220_006004 [cf. Caloplaca sp. 1 TL-2023]